MSEEKITFVNGEPAKCGCQMKFSSGGGEYSDVLYVTPCVAHSPKAFGPVEVKRDEDGWWWHPGIPDFGGDEDPAPYIAWADEQMLERKGWHMFDELDGHPYEDGAAHCNGWEPESPGPEWFLMGIFDTEDGPCVNWARRISQQVTP